ncbi:SDR family oxidoreductase [Mesorhizobium sp.]|uniref:SDR family oxidoreductase n=1 Tax=Mesorhizobium sp. TaxID=1871066 RepID=UPI0025BD3EF3|nr:SDR family oxidoreductase [Mesorhizobium sp.]
MSAPRRRWAGSASRRRSVKRLGAPEDVVGPVLFFASDQSAFVTGQALNVDGGIYYQ